MGIVQVSERLIYHSHANSFRSLQQSRQHVVFVAVAEQNVIGWIGLCYHISLESPPLCEVHGLVVDERFRRRGIGRALLEKAKEWSLGQGTYKLKLRCNIKRTQSILFYRHQ